MKFYDTPYLLAAPVENIPGNGYIIQTDPPFNIAKILRFKKVEDNNNWLSVPKNYQYEQVPGYRIYLQEAGTLQEAGISEDIRIVLASMANWYLKKVELNKGKFRIFKNKDIEVTTLTSEQINEDTAMYAAHLGR